ncbi:MAG: hypothetical protein H0V31_00145 [Acidobacteria bacterium]|nr:hypothetical protein [Acidobacteriota bacterium]
MRLFEKRNYAAVIITFVVGLFAKQRLTEVFDNLLQNAIAAMPNGGEIRAKIFRENEFVGVKIADTGCGIGEVETEKIFEPFFTTKDEGTGLGLAIARALRQTEGNRSEAAKILGINRRLLYSKMEEHKIS